MSLCQLNYFKVANYKKWLLFTLRKVLETKLQALVIGTRQNCYEMARSASFIEKRKEKVNQFPPFFLTHNYTQQKMLSITFNAKALVGRALNEFS